MRKRLSKRQEAMPVVEVGQAFGPLHPGDSRRDLETRAASVGQGPANVVKPGSVVLKLPSDHLRQVAERLPVAGQTKHRP